MSRISITDTSLRDGSHSVSHQYTSSDVEKVVAALDDAGIDIIEVTHGDGLGGSSLTYGYSVENELDLVSTAVKVAKKAKIAVLLVPGIGTLELLKEAHKRGASVVRVATHITEADVSEEYIKAAKQMGMFVVGFLDDGAHGGHRQTSGAGTYHGILWSRCDLCNRFCRRVTTRRCLCPGSGIEECTSCPSRSPRT